MSFQSETYEEFMNKYIIGRTFGAGRTSVVKFIKTKKTTDNPIEEEYALKIKDRTKIPANYPVFLEIEVLRRISHENIIKLYDAWITPTHQHLVLEYISGRNLCYYVENCFSFPRDEIAKIMRDLASALTYLQTLKISHRNINLKNLVLDVNDSFRVICLKVIDFGSVSVSDTVPPFYKCTPGSLQFLAPEIRFPTQFGCNVDVWSAGVVLCYLIFGMEIYDFDFVLNDLTFIHLKDKIPNWFRTSYLLQDLIIGMLDKNRFTRFEASVVLHHSWIRIYTGTFLN